MPRYTGAASDASAHTTATAASQNQALCSGGFSLKNQGTRPTPARAYGCLQCSSRGGGGQEFQTGQMMERGDKTAPVGSRSKAPIGDLAPPPEAEAKCYITVQSLTSTVACLTHLWLSFNIHCMMEQFVCRHDVWVGW